jgi:hypothetical protein
MMDNITIGENMMMGPNIFIYLFKKIIFINNVKQLKKYCHGMSVHPPPPQLVSTTLYMGASKIKAP